MPRNLKTIAAISDGEISENVVTSLAVMFWGPQTSPQNPPHTKNTTLYCASIFLVSPCPPGSIPSQFLFPKPPLSGTSELLFLVEEGSLQGLILGRGLDGVAPKEKKENP